MANTEALLLRKGLHADLVNPAKCPIVPGAISITTDEPGIYIDLAQDDKHTENYRIRIGDVIVVPKLEDLLNSTATDAQKFSANALYYAEDKNVLCKYNPSTNKFIWINDTSTLSNSISTLNTAITTINNTIGQAASGNAATAGKTLFGAIETEYARAVAAEQALQAAIDAIAGEDGGSIAELEEEVNALGQTVNKLSGDVSTNYTELSNKILAEVTRATAEEAAIRKAFEDADIQLKDELLDKISENIAAANSMTFKGSIGYNNLGTDLVWPLTNVQAGDTYVVYASGMIASHDYHAGDLIIATHDQLESEVTYPTGIGENGGWIHVETGYNDAIQSKLSVANNQIALTSHAGTSLGAVTFASSSENLEITTNAANNTIQVGLVWAAF